MNKPNQCPLSSSQMSQSFGREEHPWLTNTPVPTAAHSPCPLLEVAARRRPVGHSQIGLWKVPQPRTEPFSRQPSRFQNWLEFIMVSTHEMKDFPALKAVLPDGKRGENGDYPGYWVCLSQSPLFGHAPSPSLCLTNPQPCRRNSYLRAVGVQGKQDRPLDRKLQQHPRGKCPETPALWHLSAYVGGCMHVCACGHACGCEPLSCKHVQDSICVQVCCMGLGRCRRRIQEHVRIRVIYTGLERLAKRMCSFSWG